MTVSTTRKAGTVLLADDEPFNLNWLVEYLEAKQLEVCVCNTVDAALDQLDRARFRIVIADLSIPLLAAERAITREPLVAKYPGLSIAIAARDSGHTDRQVIIYSVHDDASLAAASKEYGCTYLLKGRPRQFKDEIDDVLRWDPLASD